MQEIYAYLKQLEERFPPFNPEKWIPISVRYRHLSVKVIFKTDFEVLFKQPTTDELLTTTRY